MFELGYFPPSLVVNKKNSSNTMLTYSTFKITRTINIKFEIRFFFTSYVVNYTHND